MATYKSTHTGQQIDDGVDAALNPDVTVTPDSGALVTSGAVADALENIDHTITSDTDTTLNGILAGNGSKVMTKAVDSAPTASSANLVTSGGVKSALDNKQNILTFDSTPTSGSTNPVTSAGIRAAIDQVNSSPLVAATASAMTDTSKVYVYTGSEAGYTNGHWYYYNGSAWADGGVYNAVAVNTDTTLTLPGVPADAKAAGDAVSELKSAITNGNDRSVTVLTDSDMTSGVYGDNGKNIASTTRLRVVKSYKVTAGDKVVYSKGSMTNAQISFKIFPKKVSTFNNYTQSPLATSAWLSIDSGVYDVAYSGYLIYNVRFSNDGSISVSDYSAVVSLDRQVPTEWAEKISNTEYYTELIKKPLSEMFNINFLDEWVVGITYNNDGTFDSSRTDNISTKNKIPVNEGDSVVVNLNTTFNVQTLNILWYDSNENYLSYNQANNVKKITATAPTNAKHFVIDVCKFYAEPMILSQYANATIYINPFSLTTQDFINGYLSTYGDKSFTTLMQSMFVLHYSHNGYGKYQPIDTRNAIIKPISFPYAIKVSCDSSHDFAYQYYSSRFNSNDTLTYASAWVRSVTIPANQWFCMIVRNADGTTTDNTTTQSLTFEYDNTSFFVEEIEDARVDVDGNAHSTVGEHIRAIEDGFNPDFFTNYEVTSGFLKRSVKVERLGGYLTYAQAFCKYNGKYYSTDGSNIAVQDDEFNLEQTAALSLGHGNSFQLGSSNLAYISGWDDQKVYVVDLNTLTIDSTITLPTTGYTTVAVDDVNEIMYIFQRDTYPNTDDYYNFIVYDYANEQIISTKKTTVAFTGMQACDFVNGRIIVLNGFGGSPTNNGYRVYTTSGDIISELVLGRLAVQEPEGVFIDRSTHEMFISTGGKPVYRVF